MLKAAAIFPQLVQPVHADLRGVNWQFRPVLALSATFFVLELAF